MSCDAMPPAVEGLKTLWFSGTRRFQALPARVRAAVVLVAVIASAYTLWFAVDVLASAES
jgi:hypothetical protein